MPGQAARMAPTSVTESTGLPLRDEIARGWPTPPTTLWITVAQAPCSRHFGQVARQGGRYSARSV